MEESEAAKVSFACQRKTLWMPLAKGKASIIASLNVLYGLAKKEKKLRMEKQ